MHKSNSSTGYFHKVPPEEPGYTSTIIGDSNLRFMQPPTCHTVCYPGDDFTKVAEIIDSIKKATLMPDFYCDFEYTQLEGNVKETFFQWYI